MKRLLNAHCKGIFPLAPADPESKYLVVDLDQDQTPDLVERSSVTWRKGTPDGGFEAARP